MRIILSMLLIAIQAFPAVYHVLTTGSDDNGRDGRSKQTAWKTLAYACERVPEGNHDIVLGAGTFTAAKTAVPKSGFTIRGNGKDGADATVIQASRPWNLEDFETGNHNHCRWRNYLVGIRTWEMGLKERVHNVTMSNMRFMSSPGHMIDGALFLWDTDSIVIHDVVLESFRGSGIFLAHSKYGELYDSEIINAARGYWNDDTTEWHWGCGSLHLLYSDHVEIHEVAFRQRGKHWGADAFRGYAGRDVHIYNCTFTGDPDVAFGLDIEVPWCHAQGYYIHGNTFRSPISLPAGEDANPVYQEGGHPCTFWIHDNYMPACGYVIELPPGKETRQRRIRHSRRRLGGMRRATRVGYGPLSSRGTLPHRRRSSRNRSGSM